MSQSDNELQRFKVDVFLTVRVAVNEIVAKGPVQAAQIANQLDFSGAVGRVGYSAWLNDGIGQRFETGDVDIQELDALYYGIYPVVDEEDGTDDRVLALHRDYSLVKPDENPADRHYDLLSQLIQALDKSGEGDFRLGREHLALLIEAAKATNQPRPFDPQWDEHLPF
ncbi:hypothetical protein V0M98_32460 (plasmid) [Pseudomonas silesiensis]|uniref:hypothetical protein n=1 Tax=Pseudomonas silesiensis TaxID=1853130 RepID=UPI0030CD339A